MKKFFLPVLLLVLFFSSSAQKGENLIGVAVEIGVPTGDFGDAVNVGFGGALRLLFGVSDEGQFSVTTGYSGYKVKNLPSPVKLTYSIVPILAGYRHNFSGLYLEPQLGVGVYGLRGSAGGQSDSDSKAAFTWAAGFGFARKGVDIGVRYQSGKINDADSPFSIIGIHFGYNFTLSGTR